jgi:hypothetical protein
MGDPSPGLLSPPPSGRTGDELRFIVSHISESRCGEPRFAVRSRPLILPPSVRKDGVAGAMIVVDIIQIGDTSQILECVLTLLPERLH